MFNLSVTADLDNLSTSSFIPLTPFTKRLLAQTPDSNTGSSLRITSTPPSSAPVGLAVHLDYLAFCGKNLTLLQINQLLDDSFDTLFDYASSIPSTCGISYKHFVRSPLGHTLHYNLIEGTLLVQYRITFPGKPLSSMSHESHWEFIQACRFLQMRPTRLDVAIDDFDLSLDSVAISQALVVGNVKGIRSYKEITSGLTGLVSRPGWTICLGSRDSDKYIRIYDKFVESKGVIDSIRYEAELKDDYANNVWELIYGSDNLSEAMMIAAQIAVGLVDFVDRESDSNVSRCDRLSFWQDFIDRVGGSLKLSVPRVQQTISKVIKFVEHSVSKSLAKIALTKGYKWLEQHLEDCLKDGINRLNSMDYALIETYKMRNRSSIDKAVSNMHKYCI